MPRPHPQSSLSSADIFPRSLTRIISIGIYAIFIIGIVAVLADWFTAFHFLHLWLQCAATSLGCLLILIAARHRSQSKPSRFIVLCGGLLLLFAILDSLDGKQDWLPQSVVLFSVWSLLFAYTCLYLLAPYRIRTRRHWLAIGLAGLASLSYFVAAIYYAFVHIAIAPLQFNHHLLFGIGVVIAPLINWLGEIGAYSTSPVTGTVRVCPSCGLRNIPERTRCKRCQEALGETQFISKDGVPT